MIQKTLAVLAFVLFIGVLPASAQTPGPTQAAPSASTNTASTNTTVTVVADINLGDVTVTEKDGVFTGTFTLLGKMGEQSNILYGVVAYDQNRSIVDVYKLGEEQSIRQGELKQYNFSYTVPKSLKGNLSLMLIAETKDGLILGGQEFAKRTFAGTGSTYSCTATKERTAVTCSSTVADILTASYVTGSIFSASLSSETKKVAKGASVTFTPTLPPGSYYALVKSKNGMATMVVPFVVAGNYGKIQNIAVSEGADGALSVIVAANAVPSTGATVSAKLTDTKGTLCGENTVPLSGNVASFSLTSSCTEGTITATLYDAGKTALDSLTAPFSTKTVTPTTGMSQNNFFLLVLAILLIMALAYFISRKKSEPSFPPVTPPAVPPIVVALLVVGGTLFGGAPAYAMSWGVSDMVDGEFSHMCGGSTVSDKSSYAPGDTMILSSTLTLDTDVPRGASADCSVGYKTDPPVRYDAMLVGTESASTIIWTPAGGVLNSSLPYSTSQNVSFPVYSTLSTGSHYLGLRPCVWTYNSPSPSTAIGYACAYTSFPFTVALTPTVNIYFN